MRKDTECLLAYPPGCPNDRHLNCAGSSARRNSAEQAASERAPEVRGSDKERKPSASSASTSASASGEQWRCLALRATILFRRRVALDELPDNSVSSAWRAANDLARRRDSRHRTRRTAHPAAR